MTVLQSDSPQNYLCCTLHQLNWLTFLLPRYCLPLQKPFWNAVTKQVFSLCWYVLDLPFQNQIRIHAYGKHNSHLEHKARMRSQKVGLTPGRCVSLQRVDQEQCSGFQGESLRISPDTSFFRGKHRSSMPFCFFLEWDFLWNSCELPPYCWLFQRKSSSFQAGAAVGFFHYQWRLPREAASESCIRNSFSLEKTSERKSVRVKI